MKLRNLLKTVNDPEEIEAGDSLCGREGNSRPDQK